MRFLISIMAVVLLAFLLLAACNSHEQTPVKTANPAANAPALEPPPGDNARRITPADLKTVLAGNNAVLVDVRAESAYKDGHIKGARLIPYNEILARVGELPRDKTIVTYCSWPAEHTSAGAVTNLKVKGINNAAAVLGGFEAMKNAGFEVVKGIEPNGN